MRRLAVLTFAATAACQSADLFHIQAVPIEGATPAEEEVLRAEAARIAAFLDVRSVMLTKVTVKDDLRGELWGQYDGSKLTIELDREYTAVLGPVFRHEVCHAIDDQYGRLSQQRGRDLRSAFSVLSGNYELYPTPASRSREGFADLCGMGPGALEALAAEGSDARVPAGIADWVLGEALMRVPSAPQVDSLISAEQVGGVDRTLTMYSDGVVGVETPSGETIYFSAAGEERSGPGEDAEPARVRQEPNIGVAHFFDRALYLEEAVGGRQVAITTPRGGQQPGVFVRDADGVWAWLGAVEGAPFIHEWQGEVFFAWNPSPGVLRVDVAR